MDHAAYETLQDWQRTHTARGGSVELTGRRSGGGTDTSTGSGREGEEPAASPVQAVVPVVGTADNPLAGCRCRPWTPWRNHQCDGPLPAPPPGRRAVERQKQLPEEPSCGEPGGRTGAVPPETAESAAESGPARSAAPAAPTSPTPPIHPTEQTEQTDPVDSTGPGKRTESVGVAGSGPSGRQLVRGISAFQRNTAPLVRGELARLAREGQQPSQLFLTCADSRLVTSMITSSGPGDLFVVRNVGNLVPPPGEESGDDSVAAAIEYAVDVLKVRSLTVCGHSGCGAMQALFDAEPGGKQTPLKRWLRHGVPSLERMADTGRPSARLAGRPAADPVEQLCLTNVVEQLDHLRAYESVARALRAGELELHGMYFHVGEAQAYLLSEAGQSEGEAAVFDHVGVADLSPSEA